MARDRPVTEAELQAHLVPMREDIRDMDERQERFGEFMTGAITSQVIQEKVHKSRNFWMGFAIASISTLIATLALLAQITAHG